MVDRRTPGESVAALEEAIQVIRLMWSGERGVHFDGKFYQLQGVHTGPKPAHPMGIWLAPTTPDALRSSAAPRMVGYRRSARAAPAPRRGKRSNRRGRKAAGRRSHTRSGAS